MKAILEFDMNEIDDVNTHKRMMLSDDIIFCMWQFDQYLRKHIKYDETLTEEQHDIFVDVRKHLHDILNEKNINLDTL